MLLFTPEMFLITCIVMFALGFGTGYLAFAPIKGD